VLVAAERAEPKTQQVRVPHPHQRSGRFAKVNDLTRARAHTLVDELLQEEGGDDEELELTESERNMLKQENTTLQHNFETLVDKTREIEKQVIEISHLQTLFANKVSQQKVVPPSIACACARARVVRVCSCALRVGMWPVCVSLLTTAMRRKRLKTSTRRRSRAWIPCNGATSTCRAPAKAGETFESSFSSSSSSVPSPYSFFTGTTKASRAATLH